MPCGTLKGTGRGILGNGKTVSHGKLLKKAGDPA